MFINKSVTGKKREKIIMPLFHMSTIDDDRYEPKELMIGGWLLDFTRRAKGCKGTEIL